MIYGTDVSQWQGRIDWGRVRGSKSFAIIKAGGSDAGRYEDSRFVINRDATRQAGIPRGFYYFGYGVNGVLDARHFKSIVGNLKKGESIWLDFEVETANPVGYCLDFIKEAKKQFGVQCHLYTNMGRVYQFDWSPVVRAGAGLWGAYWDYRVTPFPNSQEWPFVAVKQYSNSGTVPGVSGLVDLDVFNGTASQFQKYGKQGILGKIIKAVKPKPKPKPAPRPAVYVVKKGDALSRVFPNKWRAIAKKNHLADPNRIYPGQKLYIIGSAPASVAHQYYTVKKGDTLSKVFPKDWRRIAKLNRLKNPNLIYPGQRLRIK